jgi:2-keto-3-deoxy-L-rhamnonate aldolase RhmA
MTARRIVVAALALAASVTVGIYAQGGGGGQGGGRAGGAGRQAGPPQPGNLITGAWGEKALKPDARGWGWMVKEYVAGAQRPLYNQAKEKLLQDKQVTSVTISTFNPEQYCESRKHWDYIWFEMQHSTLSFNEVQKMIGACPGPGGGAPMIRMPDALEANIQKATDLGVLGVVIPTVDDALEARDAARFSRYPPFGRRSSGAGTATGFWDKVPGGYRATINDNFLVVVMLETLESIINADEIANTFGLDVVIQGNSDLSQFSGWTQSDARYDALLNISHNATLKAGKYWGNAGQQYLTGHPLSPDTRFVQNGPSHDGFAFPARGRGAAEAAEPVIGGRGGEQPTGAGRRGGGAPK